MCACVCMCVCGGGFLHLASTFVVFGVSFAVPCRPVVGGWYFLSSSVHSHWRGNQSSTAGSRAPALLPPSKGVTWINSCLDPSSSISALVTGDQSAPLEWAAPPWWCGGASSLKGTDVLVSGFAWSCVVAC